MAKPKTEKYRPAGDLVDAFRLTAANAKATADWLASLDGVSNVSTETYEGEVLAITFDLPNGDSVGVERDGWVIIHPDGSLSTRRADALEGEYVPA